ncbi:MAG: tetratricopeptide repeat protein [Thermodesulfobacteriota bacterium]
MVRELRKKWALNQPLKTFLFLLLLTAIISGCAARSDKVDVAPPVSESPSAAVEPRQDGRHGFVIKEVPSMDGEARRDFAAAVELLAEEEYEKAIELLEKVVATSPGVTAPYINLALAYGKTEKTMAKADKTKRAELAEKHLKTALNIFPGHPVATNEYGLLLRRDGRFSEAKALYEKSLERFPDYQPAHRNLAILCDLYLNDLQCALEHYEIYSKAMPEDKQVKTWIAEAGMRFNK